VSFFGGIVNLLGVLWVYWRYCEFIGGIVSLL